MVRVVDEGIEMYGIGVPDEEWGVYLFWREMDRCFASFEGYSVPDEWLFLTSIMTIGIRYAFYTRAPHVPSTRCSIVRGNFDYVFLL